MAELGYDTSFLWKKKVVCASLQKLECADCEKIDQFFAKLIIVTMLWQKQLKRCLDIIFNQPFL